MSLAQGSNGVRTLSAVVACSAGISHRSLGERIRIRMAMVDERACCWDRRLNKRSGSNRGQQNSLSCSDVPEDILQCILHSQSSISFLHCDFFHRNVNFVRSRTLCSPQQPDWAGPSYRIEAIDYTSGLPARAIDLTPGCSRRLRMTIARKGT